MFYGFLAKVTAADEIVFVRLLFIVSLISLHCTHNFRLALFAIYLNETLFECSKSRNACCTFSSFVSDIRLLVRN